MTPPLGPMRTGRHLGRTLYLDTGEDWTAHQCIGMVDTPEQAQAIVAAVNGAARVGAITPALMAELFTDWAKREGILSRITEAECADLALAFGAGFMTARVMSTPKSPAGHPRDGE